MPTYLLGRVVSLILSLVAASIVIFLVLEVVPGDPAQFMLGLNATPEAVAALRHALGLDGPLVTRYFTWVLGLLHGDFGISYTYKVPVAGLIAERTPVLTDMDKSDLERLELSLDRESRRKRRHNFKVGGAATVMATSHAASFKAAASAITTAKLSNAGVSMVIPVDSNGINIFELADWTSISHPPRTFRMPLEYKGGHPPAGLEPETSAYISSRGKRGGSSCRRDRSSSQKGTASTAAARRARCSRPGSARAISCTIPSRIT